MLEHIVEFVLEILIPLCELMGIAVVAVSALSAFWKYACSLVTKNSCDVKFQLASGLALSLEFKMAAEILKTILIQSLEEIYILGGIIVLRVALSLLIHFENKSNKAHKDNKPENTNKAEK